MEVGSEAAIIEVFMQHEQNLDLEEENTTTSIEIA
jgi:hypothetical protein